MLFLAAGSIYGQKLDLIHYNRREEIVIFVYTQTSIFNSLRVIMSQSLKAVSFNIAWQESFKEIQCYEDKQVNQVLRALLSDKELISVIKSLFKSDENQAPIQFERLADIHSIDAFQAWVAESIFPYIETSYDDLSVSGLDELDPATPYVFISNHRDIVMDPLILNKALREYGFSTSNCAIGDNLLQHPAANDLALLNRCFKVFRSLKSPRAMLKAMKTQSEYIRYLHFTQQGNVW
ncbi:1-acyl-sn-glycerol-3-phosphate acyltransferase, partial [Oleiphilus sp. HI0132]